MRNIFTIRLRRSVAGIVATTVIVLFVAAFASTALSQGALRGNDSVLKGEVIAVDNSNHLSTVTLRSNEIGQFPSDTLNIFLTGSTSIKICGTKEPAGDLSVSRNARIMYHEVRGLAVADTISEQC